MLPIVFVDTWGWVALGHYRDSRHRAVLSFYRDLARRGGAICTLTADEHFLQVRLGFHRVP